jgi:glycosyltransferase involved in cell wall biosynthesis
MDEQASNGDKLILAFDAKRLFNNFTGLGNYSRTLLKNLQDAYPEHEYHLFTPKITKNQETAYFVDSKKFIIHTPSSIHFMWRSWGMAKEINALKPHIFHGLSHEIPFGIEKSIKTFVTFHDLIFELYPTQFGLWDRYLYQLKYRTSAKKADRIIAISESTKNDLQQLYNINAEKIDVVYQSCHDDFQHDDISSESPILSIAGIGAYYLYVGSLIPRKGLVQIIIAFSKIEVAYRKPFVVVGKGSKEYTKKVKDLIRYYGLDEYFIFLGSLSNQDLIMVYDQSFALIYPSIYEGFGIPVIESLFRQKPVITSELSSLPEAAGPGAILVDPYSPDEIADAIRKINQKEIYSSLADNGYDYVRQRFSTEATTKAMMKLYRSHLQ